MCHTLVRQKYVVIILWGRHRCLDHIVTSNIHLLYVQNFRSESMSILRRTERNQYQLRCSINRHETFSWNKLMVFNCRVYLFISLLFSKGPSIPHFSQTNRWKRPGFVCPATKLMREVLTLKALHCFWLYHALNRIPMKKVGKYHFELKPQTKYNCLVELWKQILFVIT